MRLQIDIDPSWLNRPEVLTRVLVYLRTLEAAAPMPSVREPGDDDGDGDDLGELLAGMDEPAAPVPSAPPPKPPAAASTTATRPSSAPPAATTTPTTGAGLYRWAIDRKSLPHAVAIGKARGFPKLLKDWPPHQVAIAFRELAAGHSE